MCTPTAASSLDFGGPFDPMMDPSFKGGARISYWMGQAKILLFNIYVNHQFIVKQKYQWLMLDFTNTFLVGGLEHFVLMNFHILGTIIPFDFHIFQRGRYTTNQIVISIININHGYWSYEPT